MNVISQLRQEVQRSGVTTIDIDRFNQLQAEWITRAKIDPWISVKDRLPGKKCLATYKNRLGNRRIIIAEYIRQYEVESNGEDDSYDEYCEEKDNYYYREGWYEQQDNWGEYACIYVHEGEVTHWQPLPEPPEE